MGRDTRGRITGRVSAAVGEGAKPARGEVWMVDLDPTRGHEQRGTRPALVVSVDLFNASPAGLVVVLPITSKAKNIRSHVPAQSARGRADASELHQV